eukprot:764300-Hanusia_phi.AAC.7
MQNGEKEEGHLHCLMLEFSLSVGREACDDVIAGCLRSLAGGSASAAGIPSKAARDVSIARGEAGASKIY